MRSRASSFKWEYPLLSLRSSSSFLHLLPRLSVTSIPPCIFPSITRCRRQFLRKMWPIQFAFRVRISCRIFLCSLTLSNTSSFLTWSVQLIFSIFLQHHISKLSRCFWSTAGSVQFQPHIKLCSKCSTSLASSSFVIVAHTINNLYGASKKSAQENIWTCKGGQTFMTTKKPCKLRQRILGFYMWLCRGIGRNPSDFRSENLMWQAHKKLRT